jgi:hypothetical protein
LKQLVLEMMKKQETLALTQEVHSYIECSISNFLFKTAYKLFTNIQKLASYT